MGFSITHEVVIVVDRCKFAIVAFWVIERDKGGVTGRGREGTILYQFLFQVQHYFISCMVAMSSEVHSHQLISWSKKGCKMIRGSLVHTTFF
jgi:hypothetical protein